MSSKKLKYVSGYRLNTNRRAQVQQLWEALPDASYLSPLLGEEPVPRDGNPVYAFAYCGDRLVGFCEIYEVEEGLELRGMVASEYRRQGIFTELVNRLCEGRLGPFFFVGTGEQESFRDWAKATGRSLAERDLLMGVTVAEAYLPQLVLSREQQSLEEEMAKRDAAEAMRNGTEEVSETGHEMRPEIVIEEHTEETGDMESQLQSVSVSAYLDEEEVGGLYCLIEREAFVFDVWVEESKRRQGIARAMLVKLFGHLPGQMRVRLHVTESNVGAVALYRKLGFLVEQSIEHYAILNNS